MFYLKKNKKRMLALCLSAALSVGSLTVYAATEQWNDASLTPAFTTKTAVSEHTDWADWKANWDKSDVLPPLSLSLRSGASCSIQLLL